MKFLSIAAITLLVTGCGTDSYSPSSGNNDAGIAAMMNGFSSGWAQGRQPMPMVLMTK